jgi:serine/threonine protein kinase
LDICAGENACENLLFFSIFDCLKTISLVLVNAKVCDFDIARVPDARMTGNRGTLCWMAPEVLACETYNSPCDIWSFGVLLAELCDERGQDPFVDVSMFDIVTLIREANLPPLPSGSPSGLVSLQKKCLQRDADARPTAAVVREYLHAEYQELMVKLSPPAAATRLLSPRTPSLAIASAVMEDRIQVRK